VTITLADATGDNIRSDGRGAYTDQVDGVKAILNHSATDDLILNTDLYFTPKKGAIPRKMVFDLTLPVEGTGAIDRRIVTGADMAVDQIYDPSNATGFAQLNFSGYILRFGIGSGTDPVQVTGTAGTGPWNVITTGSAIGKLFKLQGTTFIDRGNYYMRFSIAGQKK